MYTSVHLVTPQAVLTITCFHSKLLNHSISIHHTISTHHIISTHHTISPHHLHAPPPDLAEAAEVDGPGRQAADEVPLRRGVQEHVEHERRPHQSHLRGHWSPGRRKVSSELLSNPSQTLGIMFQLKPSTYNFLALFSYTFNATLFFETFNTPLFLIPSTKCLFLMPSTH